MVGQGIVIHDVTALFISREPKAIHLVPKAAEVVRLTTPDSALRGGLLFKELAIQCIDKRVKKYAE